MLLFLAGCSANLEQLWSVGVNACFTNYKDISEVATKLETLSANLDEKNPKPEIMAIMGCYNYQLGNYTQAEQMLKQAFSVPKELNRPDVQGATAGALGLIYLREMQKAKITKPYIDLASKHWLGRWMLVLFYIEHYRVSNYAEYLIKAVEQMQAKHTIEGKTSATERLLTHIQIIITMEEVCGNDPESELCSMEDLKDEKLYLFNTAYGFLSMLLKVPPFNKGDIGKKVKPPLL